MAGLWGGRMEIEWVMVYGDLGDVIVVCWGTVRTSGRWDTAPVHRVLRDLAGAVCEMQVCNLLCYAYTHSAFKAP